MITSLFTGLSNSVRALQHAQTAVTVHGSNIAHANDSAYTRRQVLAPTEAGALGPGIKRIRDLFIDDQYRDASAGLGEAEVRQDVMTKVEDIVGDPVKGGLRQALDEFFDCWQALADEPTSGVARLQVLAAGKLFVNEVKSAYRGVIDLQATVNDDLADQTREVNNLLGQVFELNKQISYLNRNQMNDADLRDQRDLALDKLSRLVGATATEGEDGVVRVTVGSATVLDGPTVLQLSVNEGGLPVWTSADGYEQAYTGRGAVAGLVSVRDEELQSLKADIALLGKQVATKVNELHKYTDENGNDVQVDFFAGVENPDTLSVSSTLTPDDLIAGNPALPSDGETARQIALLASNGITGWSGSAVATDGKLTPGKFYENLVGWVGTKAEDANLFADVATTHVKALEEQRQSDWGVSLDEEVAALSLQQKAYAAASRVISVMDQMLDDLINGTAR